MNTTERRTWLRYGFAGTIALALGTGAVAVLGQAQPAPVVRSTHDYLSHPARLWPHK